MQEYTLSFDTLSLTVVDLLVDMGYASREPEEEIRTLTASMLADISSWNVPRCSFSLWDGWLEEDTVCLSAGERLTVGPVIASLLKGATRFALFTATVGMAYQRFQDRLSQEGDLLPIFIADSIGTSIVERAGDRMERLLEAQLDGVRHTNRFSPGYCGWHLTGQKQLFSRMGGMPCGIALSDVCLMMPIKSISGVIGIGADVDEKKYGCQYCELGTCYKRK